MFKVEVDINVFTLERTSKAIRDNMTGFEAVCLLLGTWGANTQTEAHSVSL